MMCACAFLVFFILGQIPRESHPPVARALCGEDPRASGGGQGMRWHKKEEEGHGMRIIDERERERDKLHI